MNKLIIFIAVLSVLPIVNADVISINSGGDQNLVINPDNYIENFFTGEVIGAICGNGIIEAGEQCDDGNVVSGDGCSSTCTTEVPTGGGGGGGGPAVNLRIEPPTFDVTLAVNTNVQKKINVTNLGTSTVSIAVDQQNLDNHVILNETTLTLLSGQTKQVNVIFVATNETGIFTGKILIGNLEVLVSLNIRTKLLLFDSNIVVLNKDYQILQGEELNTRVTLIPLGDPERLDVTLNYVIKDYSENVYLTKSETLLVSERLEIDRNFDIGNLPVGDYIIGLELVYPNGVAPSSAHFEVISGRGSIVGRIILLLISLILLVLILILIVLIWKRRREKHKKTPKPVR